MAKKQKRNAKQKQTRKKTVKTVRKTASRKAKKTNSSRTAKPTKRFIPKNPKSFPPKQKRKAAKSITTKTKSAAIRKRRGKNIFDIQTKGRKVSSKINSIDKAKIKVPKGFVKGAFVIIKDKKGNVIGTELTRPEQFIDEKAVKQLIKNKLEQMEEDNQQWEDGELVDDNPYADINPEVISSIELKYF